MAIDQRASELGLARVLLLAAAVLGAVILLPRSAAASSEQVLYRFCPQHSFPCADGLQPEAGLIMDAAGNPYGTDPAGGPGAHDHARRGTVDQPGPEAPRRRGTPSFPPFPPTHSAHAPPPPPPPFLNRRLV